MLQDNARLMMDMIAGRRSVRRLRPEPVPDDVLLSVLEAGRLAPSGRNEQPWKFIVVRDPQTIEEIGRLSVEGGGRRVAGEALTGDIEHRFEVIADPEKRREVVQRFASGAFIGFVSKAPAMIVVCGRKGAWDLPYDLAAATQNMLLMAHALGLGACWVAAPCADARDEARLRRLLGIPEDHKVSAVITLGYPDRQPGPMPREPLDRIAFEGAFGLPFGSRRPSGASGCADESPSGYAGARSLLEAVACDLESAFYDERGLGARHRCLLAGTGYLASRHGGLPPGGDTEHALERAATALRTEGVVGEMEWACESGGIIRLSVRRCEFLRIHRCMVTGGGQVCCCPVGNAAMWFVDRVHDGYGELAGIEVAENECRLVLLKSRARKD